MFDGHCSRGEMREHFTHRRYVDRGIVPHALAHANAAEADEEIDGWLGLEIAGAVADECGLAVRPRAHVADHELLAARAGEERAAVEVFVLTAVIEAQRDGVHRALRHAEV